MPIFSWLSSKSFSICLINFRIHLCFRYKVDMKSQVDVNIQEQEATKLLFRSEIWNRFLVSTFDWIFFVFVRNNWYKINRGGKKIVFNISVFLVIWFYGNFMIIWFVHIYRFDGFGSLQNLLLNLIVVIVCIQILLCVSNY